MDEVFFVDLPSVQNRQAIFAIHFARRNIDTSQIDLPGLASASEGFSGAEIEQAIASAIYSSYNTEGGINTELMLTELAATQPLSILMAEQIDQLRQWAKGRTVPVD
jgi:SpoVK/Ycf46/Vps4 family AAA+-type ATPase